MIDKMAGLAEKLEAQAAGIRRRVPSASVSSQRIMQSEAAAYERVARMIREQITAAEAEDDIDLMPYAPDEAQQKAQGAACGCKGTDDMCVCQNVVDLRPANLLDAVRSRRDESAARFDSASRVSEDALRFVDLRPINLCDAVRTRREALGIGG